MTIDYATFADVYRQAKSPQNKSNADAQVIIDALPYASFLGMKAQQVDGDWQFILPPQKHNVGNPTLPALHGGAIAGFMEMSAVIYLMMNMDVEEIAGHEPRVPKVVDFSIDYIRACRLETTHAACEILRRGRRLTNIAVRIWQQNPDVFCAAARVHYLVD